MLVLQSMQGGRTDSDSAFETSCWDSDDLKHYSDWLHANEGPSKNAHIFYVTIFNSTAYALPHGLIQARVNYTLDSNC
eukprot:6192567-Pleurochrysis_carterae.AAC.2